MDDLEAWDEAAAAVAWFLASEPPSEPFVLRRDTVGPRAPAITVRDPALYWHDMRIDIEVGPGARRDAYGAVKADVLTLYDLFGGVV